MSGIIGNLPSFDLGDDWCIFKERLKLWLGANSIKQEDVTSDNDRRRAVLLSALSDSAYKLVRELIAPGKVDELTCDQLITEIDKHFLPKKSVLAERHRFHSAAQGCGEDYSQWAARVRQLSSDCKFGSALDEMLRDRFVLGMQPGAERDKLFMEDSTNLTLNRALDIAVTVRSARQAARQSTSAPTALGAATPLGPAASAQAGLAEIYRVTTAAVSSKCVVCGFSSHSADKCRFKYFKCNKCGEKGHLKRMCKGNNKQINMLHSTDESYEDDGKKIIVCNIRSFRGEAMRLCVKMGGKVLEFEVDSGSCATAIPLSMYNLHFKSFLLSPPKTILKSYSGENLAIVGVAELPVEYEGDSKTVQVYVVKGGGPALLGRDFLALFNLQLSKVNNVNESEIDYYINKYPNLFSDKLGCLNKFKVQLLLKPGSHPIFFRSRPVPFALRNKIEQEIDRLVNEGVLKPVDHSDFASPIVPVLKHNGEIRLCADYSVTLNKVLQIEKYPLPRTEELFSKLHGGQQFSQLDLSKAYLQLCLDEKSQILTTINTHKGLYKFTRLVFGLSNAPAIFQKTMENLLQGIEGVLCLLDDVLVTGCTKKIHAERLVKVFDRLQEAGLVLNKDKCNLFKNSVTYLGFVIDKNGIHKSPDKVEAMLKSKPPTNLQELKSFLGLVNYYRGFVPNASSILSPLNVLLQKNVKWAWTKEHAAAFKKIKSELASERTLAHYDPTLKLVLTVDASPSGLGAILAQVEGGVERPIAYASRSLNRAERNYSQIQKEATAIIFGIRRFHQYLYGLETAFILRTDHKPLIFIFHPSKGVPEVSANRLQRYALFLNSYNYEIQYIKSASNIADYLSRASAERSSTAGDGYSEGSLPRTSPRIHDLSKGSGFMDRASYINFVTDGDLPITLREIRTESNKDAILQSVERYVNSSWPKKCKDKELRGFYSCRNEIALEQGCLIRGHKLIIPKTLQTKILDELHRSHLGINKTESEARSRFWWPNIDRDIESRISNCPICMQLKQAPARVPLTPWPFPQAPWHRVHLDFFGPLQGKMFLIIVDAYTKWVECFPLNNNYSSSSVIEKLEETMSRFGIMRTLVTDNGSLFTSAP